MRFGYEIGEDVRFQQYDLGPDTIFLARPQRMLVAQGGVVSAEWEEEALVELKLHLLLESTSAQTMADLGYIEHLEPSDSYRFEFEVDPKVMKETLLAQIEEAEELSDLVALQGESFPLLLNLEYYQLKRVVCLTT